MNNLFTAIALTIGIALPISAISTIAAADPHYWVKKGPGSVSDGKVYIMSHAGHGKVKCVVPEGNYLNRNHEQNWSRYIHVQWEKSHPWEDNPLADVEWKYKDANGKWCPIWDRRGWVDKADPDLRVLGKVSHYDSPTSPGALRAVPDTWTSTVHTTGTWGNDVPVFTDSGTYFNARKSMEAHGHYRDQENKVQCRFRRGAKVIFKPYKDWGVGEVWPEPFTNSNKGCSGWIDRGVIR